MHVLVLGSGGREHALAWAIARSPLKPKVTTAPGNAGTARLGGNIDLDLNDFAGIGDFCKEEKIDLVVIGPEAPLVAGLADPLRARGIPVFGPSGDAARLEGSKIFGKEFCRRHGIPTAAFKVFEKPDAAHSYIDRSRLETCVVKADGLASGKGVLVCDDPIDAHASVDTCMLDRKFGDAGDRIIIEDRLEGFETTLMTLVAGSRYFKFPYSQDHKRAYDGDKGPNTGGMGVFAPTPKVTPELDEQITREIVEPTIAAFAEDGIDYVGCLYFGIMVTEEGPYLLEFNCRFGDPEVQAVLPLVEGDFLAALVSCAHGELESGEVAASGKKAVAVILASKGYPEKYRKGVDVTADIRALEKDDRLIVFHAGTRREGKKVLTSGGRVVAVTAVADEFQECRRIAYDAIKARAMEGLFYRTDIGHELVAVG
jgi:phosphoribosylamine--glycine ligase